LYDYFMREFGEVLPMRDGDPNGLGPDFAKTLKEVLSDPWPVTDPSEWTHRSVAPTQDPIKELKNPDGVMQGWPLYETSEPNEERWPLYGDSENSEDEDAADAPLPEPYYDSQGNSTYGQRERFKRAVDELFFPTGKTEAERLAYENKKRISSLKAARRKRLAERLARQAAYMGFNQPE
jgi:hypothetical protein